MCALHCLKCNVPPLNFLQNIYAEVKAWYSRRKIPLNEIVIGPSFNFK